MKKLSFYLIVFFLLINYSGSAQNISIGVRGGISIPNLTAGGSEQNPLNTGYKSRLGPDFAIFSNFGISKIFSIQPMVEYSSQGGKKDGMQAFPNPYGSTPTYLYANFKSEAKMNYLLVPVLAKLSWHISHSSPISFYADAGPFAGFLLNAKQVTSGSSPVYADPQGTTQVSPDAQSFDNTQDIKSQLHSTNFGVEANVGFSDVFGKSEIFIEGGGNYGFLNIQKGTANGKNNIGAGTVTVGYAYFFGKK